MYDDDDDDNDKKYSHGIITKSRLTYSVMNEARLPATTENKGIPTAAKSIQKIRPLIDTGAILP